MKNLTKSELDSLLAVAKKYSELDALMFSVMFVHGLRVSEATGLTAANVIDGNLVLQRLKGSNKTSQPMLYNRAGLEALAKKHSDGSRFWMAKYAPNVARNKVWRLMRKYGAEAGIHVTKLHCHVLKHTTGRLAYLGGMGLPELQTYLGHKCGSNTMIYVQSGEEEACKSFAKAVGQ